MQSTRTYWFGRKRIGVGYGPRTWQGWTAIGAYAVLLFAVARSFGDDGNHTLRLASMVGITIAFLMLFLWKLDRS